jgi:GH15 family glucan-1,4-alpha-glucosidase
VISALLLLLGAAPHFSYPKLVTANGYGAVIFVDDRLTDAYPHLYQEYTDGVVTPEVLYDSYFGVTDLDGAGGWLTDTSDASATDGIFQVERTYGDLAVTEYDFAPMGMDGFGLAQVAHVVNNGTSTTSAFQLVALLNWHVGGTETVASASAEDVSETGDDIALSFDAPGATDVSCASVYDTVLAGGRIGGGCTGSGDDMVPAFGWTIPALAPGEGVWVGVHTSTVGHDWIADRDPEQWVTDEQAWWDTFHAEGTEPAGMTEDETATYRQALAFLKMGQVREEGDAYGQIPASLPLSAPVGEFQHIWNITWVRDGSYAVAALASAGYAQEASDALRFLIQEGKTGEYRAYVGDADYAVSVCRVYGDGTEWSDVDTDGPNIEFDDFGLFLWALDRAAAVDPTLLDDVAPRALDGVADVLMGLIDPNTGLLLPDSSIWERHWNGNQKAFTYSSVWAVAGLRAAADLADSIGDPRGDDYRTAADGIADAIGTELLDAQGVLAGSLEELEAGDDYLDLAAVEAYNLGILDATDTSFDASLDAWDRDLKVASGTGYHRNDDGSDYDEHEWIVIDLRLAEALRRAGRPDDAAELEDWVTAQAALNNHILPELLDPVDADYAGPAPMLGFGSGAYVLAMNGRADADLQSWNPKLIPGERDCLCGGSGGAGSALGTAGALALLLPLLRRRRRT